MCKKLARLPQSRPWPPPDAARPGLMAPRARLASMALQSAMEVQASTPGHLPGKLGCRVARWARCMSHLYICVTYG